MAALRRPSPPFLLLLLTFTSRVSQSLSAGAHTCTSANFTNKKVYTNCTNLPTLKSKLHWTYTPENSSLSIAFVAHVNTPNGWIAWAINPTRAGMVGSQALIAFKDSKGSMTMKTYNITSYLFIKEGKIAYEVTESSTEYSDGMMMIFATLKLPERIMNVNQVWQVGNLVRDGKPKIHRLLTENMLAKGRLSLRGEVHSNGTVVDDRRRGGHYNSSSGSFGVKRGIVILIGCLLLGFYI
ncbi:hypothetical protein QVD17_02750 [Tagetes erecta]|uniref:DOMON domain-containing protein n=1 Tax=Tagetes erecta TaxID=13708 RepID=A0AAD8P9F2_TARER|nr:hypothetical protein QVD17_02750 [Tagetes erecta]